MNDTALTIFAALLGKDGVNPGKQGVAQSMAVKACDAAELLEAELAKREAAKAAKAPAKAGAAKK